MARTVARSRPWRPLLVSGYGGAGKTWAVLELALLVAAGEKRFWGGVDLELSGPVLHIDFEMGLQALKWRIQRLAYGRGIDLASLGARLQVSSLPKLTLTDPRAEEVLLRACEGKALVVIDNNAAGSRGSTKTAPRRPRRSICSTAFQRQRRRLSSFSPTKPKTRAYSVKTHPGSSAIPTRCGRRRRRVLVADARAFTRANRARRAWVQSPNRFTSASRIAALSTP